MDKWEENFDKKFPDIISLGALKQVDVPDLEFRIKHFISALLREARKDELERIAMSDKGESDFDSWDYLDQRTKELSDGES